MLQTPTGQEIYQQLAGEALPRQVWAQKVRAVYRLLPDVGLKRDALSNGSDYTVTAGNLLLVGHAMRHPVLATTLSLDSCPVVLQGGWSFERPKLKESHSRVSEEDLTIFGNIALRFFVPQGAVDGNYGSPCRLVRDVEFASAVRFARKLPHLATALQMDKDHRLSVIATSTVGASFQLSRELGKGAQAQVEAMTSELCFLLPKALEPARISYMTGALAGKEEAEKVMELEVATSITPKAFVELLSGMHEMNQQVQLRDARSQSSPNLEDSLVAKPVKRFTRP